MESEPTPVISKNPIRSYKVPINSSSKLINCSNETKYKIKSLYSLKEKLSAAKSQLDSFFDSKDGSPLSRHFPRYWKEFDPLREAKDTVALMSNNYNISNAWLKCYELISYYELFGGFKGKFIHFDNAAFPGSFLLATHHYASTINDSIQYVWKASSLLDINEETQTPLEDKYGLYEFYADNWLMNDKNNGDVLVEGNQRDFYKQIGGKVNLYTSDLGFDVSADYNNQELIQLPANIGQIISGLVTLAKGGSFITKQYTYFESITVSIIYAAATFFKEFYICKPYSSREANSEVYLVGKGFKGFDTDPFENEYILAMLDRIKHKSQVPLFDPKQYPKEFLNMIVTSATNIYEAQIAKINHDIESIKQCVSSAFRGPTSQNPMVVEFIKAEEPKIESWYYHSPIKPIDTSKRLRMKDALGQRKAIQ